MAMGFQTGKNKAAGPHKPAISMKPATLRMANGGEIPIGFNEYSRRQDRMVGLVSNPYGSTDPMAPDYSMHPRPAAAFRADAPIPGQRGEPLFNTLGQQIGGDQAETLSGFGRRQNGLRMADGGVFAPNTYGRPDELDALKRPNQGRFGAIDQTGSQDAMQGNSWAPGLRDGGDLRTGQGGNVPGTGEGDKIPAKYEPGEFVVSNDMLAAKPGMREQLHAMRAQVLAGKGKTPEQADARNAGVIDSMGAGKGAGKGFKPELFFTNGGGVDDERKKNSFGDAAASQSASVQQIPTAGNPPAPASDGSQNSTELSRNITNGLNALGGIGAVAAAPLQAARSAAGALPVMASPAAKLASNVASGAGLAGAVGFKANAIAGMTPGDSGLAGEAPAPAAPTAPANPQAGGGVIRYAPNYGPAGLNPGAREAALAQTAAAAPAAPAAPSEYGRQMGEIGGFVANGVGNVLKTIVSAPGYGFNQAASPAAAAAQAAAPVAPIAQATRTDVQRGGANAQVAAPPVAIAPAAAPPAPAAPAAPAPAPADPNAPTNNVTRVGNSYSGGNVAGNITVNGQQPGGGFMVVPALAPTQPATGFGPPQQAAPANAGMTILPDTGGFGILDKGYQERRNAGFALSSNSASPAEKAAAIQALGNLDQRNLQRERDAAETGRDGVRNITTQRGQDVTREGMYLQNSAAQANTAIARGKLGIDEKEFGLKSTAAGFKVREAQQLEAAQRALLDPNTPPEQRDMHRENIRALLGKDKAERPVRAFAVPGGQAMTKEGQVYTMPSKVYDPDSQKYIEMGQSAAAATPKAQYDTLKKGEKYTGTDGKEYIKG